MPPTPKASIIIRTKNEEAWIERTLEKVLQQRYDPFEVIVVDSGSTDKTLEIVSRFPVRRIDIPSRDFSYGRALNQGMKEASGNLLVSLSAHAVPLDRDWLANLLAPLGDSSVAGVVGKSLPHPDCNPFDRRGLLRRFGTERRYLHYDSIVTFSNADSAIRRAAWEQEPFDEDLPYSEDIAWFRKMKRAGWNFVYEPRAAVYHSHNETAGQLYARFYNEARARSRIDPPGGRYSPARLIFDLLAGSVYDLWTVWRQGRKAFWYGFALCRRFQINRGRYHGSRSILCKQERRPAE